MSSRHFQELIPWMFLLNDHIIVNKDGSLLSCFRVHGLNQHNHTEHQEAEARQQWAQTLHLMSDHPLRYFWVTHRRQQSHTPHDNTAGFVTRCLQSEWQRTQEQCPFFESRHYLVIEHHYARSLQRMRERIRFFMQSQRGHPIKALIAAARTSLDPTAVFSYSPEELTHIAAQFEEDVQQILGANPQLHYERLSNREGSLGQFLEESIHLSPMPLVPLPQEGFFLDEFVSQCHIDVEQNHLHFQQAEAERSSYIGAMTLRFAHQGEIATPTPLLMDTLNLLPVDFSLVHTTQILHATDSVRYLRHMHRYFHHREYSLRAYIAAVFNGGQFHEAMRNTGYHEQAEECERILSQITQNMLCLGWHNSTLLVSAPSAAVLSDTMSLIKNHLHEAGVRCLIEKEHLLSSYCLSLHNHRPCARWQILSSHNITDYLPFIYLDTGHPEAKHLCEQTGHYCPPLVTARQSDHTPWHWDPHDEDNGHAFIIGPTGSGKSILGNLISLQYLQYPHALVIIFDKDHSARIPILLQDGHYLDAQAMGHLNPCAHIDRHEEWVIEWIATLLPDNYGFRQEEYQDIKQAIVCTKQLPRHLWRLASIVLQLSLPPLKEALLPWTEGQRWGHYFDHTEDDIAQLWTHHQLIGLDAHHMMISPHLALPFISYLMFHIEEHLDHAYPKGPTLLYFSEAWQLMHAHRFQVLLVEWLKRFRKKCASIIFDTQSFEDMEVSSLFPSIRDNIRTRIYLPNPYMSAHLKHKLADAYELSLEACQKIQAGHPKRDYFIHRAPRFHRIQLDLSAKALNCLRSDLRAQACFEKHYRDQHPQWKEQYLYELCSTPTERYPTVR